MLVELGGVTQVHVGEITVLVSYLCFLRVTVDFDELGQLLQFINQLGGLPMSRSFLVLE